MQHFKTIGERDESAMNQTKLSDSIRNQNHRVSLYKYVFLLKS